MSTLNVDFTGAPDFTENFIDNWIKYHAATHGLTPEEAKTYIERAIQEEREMPQYADCPAMVARGHWLMTRDKGSK